MYLFYDTFTELLERCTMKTLLSLLSLIELTIQRNVVGVQNDCFVCFVSVFHKIGCDLRVHLSLSVCCTNILAK